MPIRVSSLAAILFLVPAALSAAPSDFVGFESDPVRPLALSPDGRWLFVANTPDGRLELFRASDGGLWHLGSVPVGVEPVTVATRTDREVWVVNHLSDSVSIVEIDPEPRVARTLLVGDAPRDLVFAGPQRERAFVTAAHRGQRRADPLLAGVPGAGDPRLLAPGVGRADVWVFDALDAGEPSGGRPIAILELFGDTPRALAATPDGRTVYAAVFLSGNQTTTIAEAAVCDGGERAPSCTVSGRAMPGGLPGPNTNVDGVPGPETGLIVRRNRETGSWEDPLGRDWSEAVPFRLPDLDVFEIDAMAAVPRPARAIADVGTVLFNMAVNPVTGALYVTNTEANNHVRFAGSGASGASTVRGRLHRSRVTVVRGDEVLRVRLNPHLDADPRASPTGAPDPPSLATPVDLAVSDDGGTLYVAGLGSDRIAVYPTAALERGDLDPAVDARFISVTGGPAGIALDEPRGRLYVLTRFDLAVHVIDLASGVELGYHPLHNPEPPVVTNGRRLLYDATHSSENGEGSCASCHVFGDVDGLAWDLGDPELPVVANPNPAFDVHDPELAVFHPLKGPMSTQTLRGLAGHGPMHWRGDRTGGGDANPDPFDEGAALLHFNDAFVSLLGRERPLDPDEMQRLADFILELTPAPNPNRRLDGTLTEEQRAAFELFSAEGSCARCHASDRLEGRIGTSLLSTLPMNGPTCGATQVFKIPSLREVYRKVGRYAVFPVDDPAPPSDEIRGFGLTHDGHLGGFLMDSAAPYLMVFESSLAPVVGQQATAPDGPGWRKRLELLVDRARAPFRSLGASELGTECDLVAKGWVDGEARGWFLAADGLFASDRSAEIGIPLDELLVFGSDRTRPLSFTCVPPGSGRRAGVDRDVDGVRDRDELDAGTDPADGGTLPGACRDARDNDRDGRIDLADPGCRDADRTREDPACDDGRDDDGDGHTDANDPDCGGWRDGPTEGPDRDGDGVADEDDNCIEVANGPLAGLDSRPQRDGDGDGFGDRCDADLDADRTVGLADLARLTRSLFGRDPIADLNADGIVDFRDLGRLRARFGLAPGPSGLPCAGDPPCRPLP